MWARVKGRTENALLRLPFKAAYMFRPGLIQPEQGVRSKTRSYQLIYGNLQTVLPLLLRGLPERNPDYPGNWQSHADRGPKRGSEAGPGSEGHTRTA